MLLWVILQLKFFKVGKWIGAREPWIHGILENGVVGLVLLISKFPYQIHVYCFQNITQHREYDWYILIELNNRIITVIEAMVTFKPHKNKENEIEHYVYQSVNQTLGTFSQLFFFFFQLLQIVWSFWLMKCFSCYDIRSRKSSLSLFSIKNVNFLILPTFPE